MPQEETRLRDDLATDRTLLANERTFLAYIRTAIMLAAVAGLTCLKLLGEDLRFLALGYVLIPLSAFVAVFGYFRFHSTRRRIADKSNAKPSPPPGDAGGAE